MRVYKEPDRTELLKVNRELYKGPSPAAATAAAFAQDDRSTIDCERVRVKLHSPLQVIRQQPMKQMFSRLAPHGQPACSVGPRV